MKTVIDVVNYYEAEWTNVIILGKNHSYEEPAITIALENNGSCNRDEFNQCVEDCSKNFYKGFVAYMTTPKIIIQGDVIIGQDVKTKVKVTYTIAPKPIYTKEMFDKSFPPKVGMKFLVNIIDINCRMKDFDGLEVKVIGISNEHRDTVITFYSETEGIGAGIYFKDWVSPLPTPIKLEDG